MRMYDIIAKKRDGKSLSDTEIAQLLDLLRRIRGAKD